MGSTEIVTKSSSVFPEPWPLLWSLYSFAPEQSCSNFSVHRITWGSGWNACSDSAGPALVRTPVRPLLQVLCPLWKGALQWPVHLPADSWAPLGLVSLSYSSLSPLHGMCSLNECWKNMQTMEKTIFQLSKYRVFCLSESSSPPDSFQNCPLDLTTWG